MTKERRLEILKDPRVGTFGALALILVTTLIATSVAALDTEHAVRTLIVAHVLAARRDPAGVESAQARRSPAAPARCCAWALATAIAAVAIGAAIALAVAWPAPAPPRSPPPRWRPP